MNAFNSSAPALSGGSSSPFDALMGTDGRWSARDLMTLVGYDKWQNFEAAIERAKLTAQNSGISVQDAFVQVSQVTDVGNLGQQERADYRLSRHAVYLVAMNGDPRKPEIAAAQTYFAVKTREAEQPKSELELARDYVRALEAKEELRAQIAELEPKASKWAEYMGTDGLIGMRELADMLGLDAKEMTRRLVELKVFRRLVSEDGGARNMPRRMYQTSGHFEVKIEQNGRKRYPVAYATTSGVEFVMHHLG